MGTGRNNEVEGGGGGGELSCGQRERGEETGMIGQGALPEGVHLCVWYFLLWMLPWDLCFTW